MENKTAQSWIYIKINILTDLSTHNFNLWIINVTIDNPKCLSLEKNSSNIFGFTITFQYFKKKPIELRRYSKYEYILVR